MFESQTQPQPFITNQIRSVWVKLPTRRRAQIIVLGMLMVLGSFAELMSIGALFPFLGVLVAPEKLFAHKFTQPVIAFLDLQQPKDLLLLFTFLFIVAAIFAACVRLLLFWCQTRLSMAIEVDFSALAFELTLHQKYSKHVSQNSSEILAGIQKASGLVSSVVQPTLTLIGSTFLMLGILAAMVMVNPLVALTALSGLGAVYLVLALLTKQRINKNSRIIAIHSGRITKAIQEGLGGIRDVLIDGTQQFYCKLYRDAYIPVQAASANNQFVAMAPRFGIEAIGLTLIASLAYMLSNSGGVGGGMLAIPVLGTLAMGAQRLLPVLQQIYSSYVTLKGAQSSNQDALALLTQPMPLQTRTSMGDAMPFEKVVAIKQLGFRYSPSHPWVLRNLSLDIPKGSRVGFVGATGSGKSTLLDVVMGLLTPTEGELLVDGKVLTELNTPAWQAHISHVPQAIFLSDTTIAENVAFGVAPELIDMQRVVQAAEKAQIAQTIESWSSGYKTIVGERGIRLSGGQRQRIGIARALYKQADVIVFDEATSALDNDTEEAVMRAIETLGPDVTVLIIAHRLTTLKKCDFVVELKKGAIHTSIWHDQVKLQAK